jgi:hypothetical protein
LVMFAVTAISTAELVKDKATKQTLDADEVERVLRGYVSGFVRERPLLSHRRLRRTRRTGRSPLICGQAEFDEMEQICATCSRKPGRRSDQLSEMEMILLNLLP